MSTSPQVPESEPEPDNLGAQLTQWEHLARTTPIDLDEDPDALLPLVGELAILRAHLTRDRWLAAARILATRIGWSDPARFDGVIRLKDPKEIRWALQARPTVTRELPWPWPSTGWLGDYMSWQVGDQVPAAFHFWTGLSVLSAALRKNAYVDKGRWVVWPDLYVLLVGVPATKKGQAMGMGKGIIERANQFLKDRGYPLAEHFRMLPQYGTIQFVIKEMQTTSAHQAVTESGAHSFAPQAAHAVWFCEELVTLLATSAFNPQASIDFLADIYNEDRERNRGTLRQGAERLYRPSIAFMGALTPYGLRSQLPRSMVEGGLVSRCVFVHRDPSPVPVATSPACDTIFRDALAERLIPMLGYRDRVIRQSREALDWEDAWMAEDYRRTILIADDRSQTRYGRRQLQLLKVAMLLVVSDGRDRIEREDMERALAIVDEEYRRASQLLDDVGSHEDVLLGNVIVDALQRHGGRLTRSRLFGLVKRKIGNSQNFERIRASLQEEGRVSVFRQGASEVWALVGQTTDP